MLVLRQNWEWSSSACPKIGRLFCSLQPWQTTYKHCFSFLQTGLIFMRHMRVLRQLILSNSSMFSFIKMWRMFISCTFCQRWRIWVFVLQSYLFPDAGIVAIFQCWSNVKLFIFILVHDKRWHPSLLLSKKKKKTMASKVWIAKKVSFLLTYITNHCPRSESQKKRLGIIIIIIVICPLKLLPSSCSHH